MKKETIYLIAISIFILQLSLSSIPLSKSAISDVGNNEIVSGIQDTASNAQDLSVDEIREKYLESEWTSFFQNNKYLSKIYSLNPIFKFLFGQEFSASWAFITGFLIWLIQLAIYYPALRTLFPDTFSALGISIVFSALSSQLIVPKAIEQLSKVVKGIFSSITLIIALIFLLIIIDRVSKELVKKYGKRRQEKRLERVEKEAEKSKTEREKIEGITRGAENMKKGAEEYREGSGI